MKRERLTQIVLVIVGLLNHVSPPVVGKLFIPVQSSLRPRWGGINVPVATRDRSKCSAMEGSRWHSERAQVNTQAGNAI
jgi:hypothetical protein